MCRHLMDYSVTEWVDFLLNNDIQRAYWIFNHTDQSIICSHKLLEPISDFLLTRMEDYESHEGIFIQIGSESGTLQAAFIHNTTRGQAQGGTRFWSYQSVFDFFFDGIRLSRGMTYKNALAGLWWGGGKGIIALPVNQNIHDRNYREKIFHDYGRMVAGLKGCYITAEDVGTTTEDMDMIFNCNRFITCIPDEKGGSGNPSRLTATGVVRGMEGALHVLGSGNLEGKTIAIQGAGNVARFLVSDLLEKKVKQIIITDIFQESLDKTRRQFGSSPMIEYRLTTPDQDMILAEKVDIIAPCATGGILNDRSIPLIQAPIICGAANNQLKDEKKHSRMVKDRQIIYVPDFLTNRMGIVNCANEQYGYVFPDPAIERHLNYEWENSVFVLTCRVVHESLLGDRTTLEIALQLAREKAAELHPIWGNRAHLIIASLRTQEWEKNKY